MRAESLSWSRTAPRRGCDGATPSCREGSQRTTPEGHLSRMAPQGLPARRSGMVRMLARLAWRGLPTSRGRAVAPTLGGDAWTARAGADGAPASAPDVQDGQPQHPPPTEGALPAAEPPDGWNVRHPVLAAVHLVRAEVYRGPGLAGAPRPAVHGRRLPRDAGCPVLRRPMMHESTLERETRAAARAPHVSSGGSRCPAQVFPAPQFRVSPLVAPIGPG